MAAPLPPPGAVLGDAADYMDSRQRSRAKAAAAGGDASVGPQRNLKSRDAKSVVSGRQRDGSGAASAASALVASVLRADDDAPLDLLGAALSSSLVDGDDPMRQLARERQRRRLAEADAASNLLAAGITVGRDGRMVIPDDEEKGGNADAGKSTAGGGESDDEDADVVRGKAALLREALPRVKGFRGSKRGGAAAAAAAAAEPGASEDGGAAPAAAGAQKRGSSWDHKRGGGGARPHSRPPRDGTTQSRFSGSQYRSKPGTSGDTQRAGAKFEPFAYVPLDPRSMSGASGSKSVARFAGVTASTSHAGRLERKQQRVDRGAGGSMRDAPGRSALGKRRH